MTVSDVEGIKKLATKCSMKLLTILVAIIIVVEIGFVSFKWRSIITMMYLFLPSVFAKGPNISAAET